MRTARTADTSSIRSSRVSRRQTWSAPAALRELLSRIGPTLLTALEEAAEDRIERAHHGLSPAGDWLRGLSFRTHQRSVRTLVNNDWPPGFSIYPLTGSGGLAAAVEELRELAADFADAEMLQAMATQPAVYDELDARVLARSLVQDQPRHAHRLAAKRAETIIKAGAF